MSEKSTFNIAIAGATGAVGATLLAILKERKFPIGDLVPLASERSAGSKVEFGNRSIAVRNLADFDFKGIDVAFFSAGGSVSREHVPRAAAAGAVVIDNTSEFRFQADVPLVISEVNPHAIAQHKARGIIANPNCSTMQMLVALAPIHRAVGIERINVATYQSVSGTGHRALEELGRQTAGLLNFQSVETKVYPMQIAFNVIPHGGDFTDNGYTMEEMKIVWETRKILEDDSIQVNPTCVRVPVFYGHSEVVHIETRTKMGADEARELLRKSPGITIVDERKAGGYPTPVTHAAGKDPVFVGRIRDDISHPRGLDFWIVADNIRKGAALNAVQIAEILIKTR
ncbi:MAG TPA: aspartate-semialdehyde dehydrogenase [Rhodanobacteraceae bacterium]|jgi:aspartate-semialdehyde dehydrogenase|nr:aspartate-semialdehyde dehydrogenase [Rhodanobacteraceae bacterium]